MQLPQMFKLVSHRSADEIQMAGHFHEGPQGHPFLRYGMTTPEGVQIDTVPVIRREHGQASQSAFRCFRLIYDGQAAAASEAQHTHCQGDILMLSNGSSNQLISDRCSRMISALRSMSA